jgi:predicted ABC-type ATPase
VKEIVILGGPNGAGKTTIARVLLPEFFELHPFLNAIAALSNKVEKCVFYAAF